MKLWVGLDIGGTKCAAVCADATSEGKPEILSKVRFETKDLIGWRAILNRFCEIIREFENMFQAAVSGIGISCGGPLDSRTGVIMSPPNLPGWDNVPIVSYFEDAFHVPVFLQNDANACAVAEWKFGAGVGSENMIFLTFGTGLGAGLILNGRLYSGTNDMAGEVGHIRLSADGPMGYGKKGSFEGYCSGGGIENLARILLKDNELPTMASSSDLTAKTLAGLARSGDLFAKHVYSVCGENLGKGLSVLVDILNPQKIVIGSIYARAADLLSEAMNKVLLSESLPLAASVCEVVPAALGEQIGDYAALGVLSAGMESMK